jgi:hypothetical protein
VVRLRMLVFRRNTTTIIFETKYLGILVPKLDDIVVLPDTHGKSADVVVLCKCRRKLLSNHCQQ